MQKYKQSLSLSLENFAILISCVVLIVNAVFIQYILNDQFKEVRTAMLHSPIWIIFFYFTMFVTAFKVLFFIYLLHHFFRYRPIPSVKDNELPDCTIIVPAYNEGEFVYETLMSISKSDYPSEKIQLLAIDDGSKDDTWQWMLKAKEELGDFVSVYQQPQNAGKRHALYRGFKLATGDVLVTIDSDSLIEENTLRNLVSPFAVDENCGAVAGNVKIHNLQGAAIPKMLNISFAFSFGFIRSAQSAMKSVLCTPGALSAYRREGVMNCLEEWINQTFRGIKTDIGEDRAMTNMLLRQGYNTFFQSNAIVYTKIPETYKTLRRMFTRWERSNVRETVMMSKFAFSNFRDNNRIQPRVLLVNQWIKLILAFPAAVLMLFFLFSYPILFISSTVVSVALFSIIPALYYRLKYGSRSSVWIFAYNLFYTFTLFWLTPFAIITASRRGWLTREVNMSEEDKKES